MFPLLICFVDYCQPSRLKWHAIVISICISGMTKDVEYLFMCLLVIYVFLEKQLFKLPIFNRIVPSSGLLCM
jgi:hypothetical protein